MSDAARGFVLLLSVVLWLPCLRPLLVGEMTAEEAGLRYGAALLLAWAGCAGVAALLKTYAPDEQAAKPAPHPPSADPTAPKTQAEVFAERRSQPRDDDAIAT